MDMPRYQSQYTVASSNGNDFVEDVGEQLRHALLRIRELEDTNMNLELELEQAVDLAVQRELDNQQRSKQSDSDASFEETELLLRAMRDLGQQLYEYQGRLIVAEAQRVSAEALYHDAAVEIQSLQKKVEEQQEELENVSLKAQASGHAAHHSRGLFEQLNEAHRELEKQYLEQSKELLLLREESDHLVTQNEQLLPQYEQVRQQYHSLRALADASNGNFESAELRYLCKNGCARYPRRLLTQDFEGPNTFRLRRMSFVASLFLADYDSNFACLRLAFLSWRVHCQVVAYTNVPQIQQRIKRAAAKILHDRCMRDVTRRCFQSWNSRGFMTKVLRKKCAMLQRVAITKALRLWREPSQPSGISVPGVNDSSATSTTNQDSIRPNAAAEAKAAEAKAAEAKAAEAKAAEAKAAEAKAAEAKAAEAKAAEAKAAIERVSLAAAALQVPQPIVTAAPAALSLKERLAVGKSTSNASVLDFAPASAPQSAPAHAPISNLKDRLASTTITSSVPATSATTDPASAPAPAAALAPAPAAVAAPAAVLSLKERMAARSAAK